MTPRSCSPIRASSHTLKPLVFKLLVLAALGLSMANASKAQDKVELFGGYSYLRASIEVGQTGPLGPRHALPA